ncbi:hypothetical protein CHELA20_50171 [Hyphomicrobiales bacterium]|jgi:hypothetical protein|nr:hypothetical protein CHELA41_20200 [Hyphomicrobiales bacterium]CAH1667183.1 hypothetical protein CHELA20_50171 [Hyphomicrobiales bacterium]
MEIAGDGIELDVSLEEFSQEFESKTTSNRPSALALARQLA